MAVSNVELRVDARNAVDQLRKTNTETKKLEQTVNKTNGRLRDANGRFVSTGKAAGTATGNIQRMGVALRTTLGPIVALVGATNLLNRSLDIAGERQAQVATLAAGLKRLGQTQSEVDQLAAAADRLGRQTLFDEEDFTAGFTLLTSFRRIGVDSYERVATAAADLAETTGQDVRSALMQLSKALEDPAKRVTDLARSGTVFTDQQKEQIKTLQESGRLLEAQNLILTEIEAQYGGAAEAAGSAGYAGAQDTLNESLRDLQEALGNLTLPAAIESLQTLTQVVDILTGKVEELRTEFRLWNAIINQVAGGLPEVGIGIGDVTNAIIESTKNLVPFVRTLELGYKFLRLMGQAQLPEDFGDMMDGGGFLPEDQPVDPTQQTLPPKPQAKPQGKVEEERMRRLQNRINAAQKYLQAEAKANAEIEKQGELLADALKSSQRAVELAEARLNGNEDEVRLQHEIADIQEKFKGNGADILIQDLKRVKALEDQKDAADALAKAEEERRKNDPGVQMQEQLDKLLDKQNQAAAAATAFGNAFSTAITSVINGTKSADQAIADMLSSVAEHFMDMAAQIIAKQLAIIAYGLIMKALGFGFNPSQDGISGLSIGSPSSFGGGNLFAADGAYVSSPTSAVVGEGGEPEYIIPESKMRESMSRYSRGARGGSVIPENGGGGSVMDGGGGTAVAAPIDVRYTVERINSVDYVTADQFQQGMQQAANQGAKQGEQQTLKRLQMSSSTRKRLGM
jgi:hypothetical protein